MRGRQKLVENPKLMSSHERSRRYEDCAVAKAGEHGQDNKKVEMHFHLPAMPLEQRDEQSRLPHQSDGEHQADGFVDTLHHSCQQRRQSEQKGAEIARNRIGPQQQSRTDDQSAHARGRGPDQCLGYCFAKVVEPAHPGCSAAVRQPPPARASTIISAPRLCNSAA